MVVLLDLFRYRERTDDPDKLQFTYRFYSMGMRSPPKTDLQTALPEVLALTSRMLHSICLEKVDSELMSLKLFRERIGSEHTCI